MLNGNVFPPKDPEEKLDYLFDWAPQANNNGLTDWLREDEVILSHEVTVPDGLTLEGTSQINDDTSVLCWISGGEDGEDYTIVCKITTENRIGVRSAILPVRKQ